jgi:hypothetical protein
MSFHGIPREPIASQQKIQQSSEESKPSGEMKWAKKGEVKGRNVSANPEFRRTEIIAQISQIAETVTTVKELKKEIKALEMKGNFTDDEIKEIMSIIIKMLIQKGDIPIKFIYVKQGNNGPLQRISDSNLSSAELRNLELFFGIKFESKQYFLFNNEDQKQKTMKNNPHAKAFVAPQNLQPQITQILQQSVEEFISMLSVANDEPKKTDTDDKRPRSSTPPPAQYNPQTDDLPAQKDKSSNLLNFPSNDLLFDNISTIALIIEGTRDQKKSEAERKKKAQIEEKELQRDIRMEEIKKEDVQKVETRHNIMESEIKAKAPESKR